MMEEGIGLRVLETRKEKERDHRGGRGVKGMVYAGRECYRQAETQSSLD